jgi:phenylacetic acid degradation operon negative regulatory protein
MIAVRAVTPKSLVLDLLRVAEPRAIPIKSFVALGALFGISDNALRVAVARLLAQGMLESDERGSYRLAARVGAVGQHVEDWRLGEKRVKRWNGGWLAIWLPRGAARSARRATERALELVGFREGLDGLRVRPDNLAATPRTTFEKLASLGLERGAQPFLASDFDAALSSGWQSSLYSAQELLKTQREAREALELSLRKLERMPLEKAAVESFLLGGSAIRILATDPLLPDEIAPSEQRARLTETMLAYDAVGRRIWRRLAQGIGFGEAPAHLRALAEGVA